MKNRKYFTNIEFSNESIHKFLESSHRDYKIATESKEEIVSFMFIYNSIIKASIALMAHHGLKLRSIPGHHKILLETVKELLGSKFQSNLDLFQDMRKRRNSDLYKCSIHISKTEIKEYLKEAKALLHHIKKLIDK
ncbi:hypothetical protein KAU33_05150 [Candidatus Dependentiae bacterium]|nr:hypothetical protein [Candidatus Dependentiae bacterium]